jgi:general stress protein YciG
MTSNRDKGDKDSNNKGNTSTRGFASMDEDKQREIASKGGKAAHERGTAHEFDSEEARTAGRKGGESVSRDREHMSDIGRKGGESSHGGTHEQHAKAGSQSHKMTKAVPDRIPGVEAAALSNMPKLAGRAIKTDKLRFRKRAVSALFFFLP